SFVTVSVGGEALTMATDRARLLSLYAGLYRTIVQFGILIAAAWLFAAFSYYLSRKTGTDWFSRSGALMGLVGAAVTFRLSHLYQRGLATAFKEGIVSVSRGSLASNRPDPMCCFHTSVI